MKRRTEEEYQEREWLIARIEGKSGCVGVWHEWETKDLIKLYSALYPETKLYA